MIPPIAAEQSSHRKSIILAAWPIFNPLQQTWIMHEFVGRPGSKPEWRKRYVKSDSRMVEEKYADRSGAIQVADALNAEFSATLANASIDEVQKVSLVLKTRKALQSKRRIQEEEALMQAEARAKIQGIPLPDFTKIVLPPESEIYRESLVEALTAMPYLRIVMIGKSNGTAYRPILYRSEGNTWSKPYSGGEKAATEAERAKIANAFGYSSKSHWGSTKARIRELIMPRANQLLQLASVKRMLDEALEQGHRVLVSNGIVFWYEEDGTLEWQVKHVASTKESEASTIWVEGKILSKNHGRLVVLPYIKENGEHVSGHTKNGPNEGRALPRHPKQYVEIPFKELDGDLMIGLFGELPYE